MAKSALKNQIRKYAEDDPTLELMGFRNRDTDRLAPVIRRVIVLDTVVTDTEGSAAELLMTARKRLDKLELQFAAIGMECGVCVERACNVGGASG